MTISPKLAVYLNVALAICLAITSGVIKQPPFMSVAVAADVTWVAGALGILGNIVLHAYSAPQAGPLVSGPAPEAK